MFGLVCSDIQAFFRYLIKALLCKTANGRPQPFRTLTFNKIKRVLIPVIILSRTFAGIRVQILTLVLRQVSPH